MVRVRVRAHSQAGWGIDYLKDDSCKSDDPMTFDQPENAWRMYDRKSPPQKKKNNQITCSPNRYKRTTHIRHRIQYADTHFQIYDKLRRPFFFPFSFLIGILQCETR